MQKTSRQLNISILLTLVWYLNIFKRRMLIHQGLLGHGQLMLKDRSFVRVGRRFPVTNRVIWLLFLTLATLSNPSCRWAWPIQIFCLHWMTCISVLFSPTILINLVVPCFCIPLFLSIICQHHISQQPVLFNRHIRSICHVLKYIWKHCLIICFDLVDPLTSKYDTFMRLSLCSSYHIFCI